MRHHANNQEEIKPSVLKRIFIKKDDALLTSYGVKTEL